MFTSDFNHQFICEKQRSQVLPTYLEVYFSIKKKTFFSFPEVILPRMRQKSDCRGGILSYSMFLEWKDCTHAGTKRWNVLPPSHIRLKGMYFSTWSHMLCCIYIYIYIVWSAVNFCNSVAGPAEISSTTGDIKEGGRHCVSEAALGKKKRRKNTNNGGKDTVFRP